MLHCQLMSVFLSVVEISSRSFGHENHLTAVARHNQAGFNEVVRCFSREAMSRLSTPQIQTFASVLGLYVLLLQVFNHVASAMLLLLSQLGILRVVRTCLNKN